MYIYKLPSLQTCIHVHIYVHMHVGGEVYLRDKWMGLNGFPLLIYELAPLYRVSCVGSLLICI